MNEEQKLLKQKLMDLGIPLSTAQKYAKGWWIIPDSIKILLKNKQIEIHNK